MRWHNPISYIESAIFVVYIDGLLDLHAKEIIFLIKVRLKCIKDFESHSKALISPKCMVLVIIVDQLWESEGRLLSFKHDIDLLQRENENKKHHHKVDTSPSTWSERLSPVPIIETDVCSKNVKFLENFREAT